ncbi:MAG: MetQ/NlpA family ABC transporter substrate-binding protein [Clostridia bacterium]|nr:MetQ/NlpA family ABC transporter substrate-binding protein [Clostridia bacterium]
MKKVFSNILIVVAAAAILGGCAPQDANNTEPSENVQSITLNVAASPTPHAEILNSVKELLAEKGVTLNVIEFTDYVQPNMVTESGEVDANYFQHTPYLDDFNAENSTHLVAVSAIHYEPFGIYPGKTKTIEELPDGAKISVPNDRTNRARALQLLAQQGLITLQEGVGLAATKLDIVENPKNIDIVEIEAAQLARTLEDLDMAVINGNYAIEAGLKVKEDAIAIESSSSEAAQTFANVIVVKEGNEDNEGVKALIEVLQSDTAKKYIEETFEGAVVPMF